MFFSSVTQSAGCNLLSHTPTLLLPLQNVNKTLWYVKIWQNLWRRPAWPVTHCLPCPLVFSLTIIYCISSTPGQLSWLCISLWGLSLVMQSHSSGAQCACSRNRCSLKSLRGLKSPSNTQGFRAMIKSSLWEVSAEEDWNVKYSRHRKGNLPSDGHLGIALPSFVFHFSFTLSPLNVNVKNSGVGHSLVSQPQTSQISIKEPSLAWRSPQHVTLDTPSTFHSTPIWLQIQDI